MKKQLLIMDMDPGVDDALALLLALRSPEIQLLGITTTAGNAPVEMTSLNAMRVLEYLNASDIPVMQGAQKPLKHRLVDALHYHGPDGLGESELPPAISPVQAIQPWDFIAHAAASNPDKITLVATGPLTNIALTLQHHPEVAHHLAGLILMGGAYGLTPYSKGNQTPYAEFNMWQDPEAAHMVFASGMNIHAIGLDISLDPTTCLYEQQLQQLQQKSAPAAAQLASKLVDYAIKHHGRCEMHDPLALAAALENMEIFGFTPKQVKITRGNGAKRGVTYALIQKKTPSLHPIYIANKVNGSRFLELFLTRITGK